MKKTYRQTLGEEIANTVSHGVMAFLCLLFIPIASVIAYARGTVWDSAAISVFSISIFLMFIGSTLYHSMALDSRHKEVFRILDHSFIYVAIAGSYTPIALSVVGGWQGWLIFSIQWAMVLFGILFKSLSRRQLPKLNLTIYLVMGWTLVLFFPLILVKANMGLLMFLLAGGIFYTIGAVFYAMKGFKYHHMVWHFCVSLGAASHAIGIVFYF